MNLVIRHFDHFGEAEIIVVVEPEHLGSLDIEVSSFYYWFGGEEEVNH